jgi:uncharacterized protein YjbI with pentapeptide repeats
MANDEHVAILKKGVAAWDAWRAENPGVLPDLSRANVSGADLSGANLSRANLDSATLVRTARRDRSGSALRTVADTSDHAARPRRRGDRVNF